MTFLFLCFIYSVNDDELTPAHQAAIEGSVNGLQALISAGAKIDIPDSKGHLPIDYAKLWGHRKCARWVDRMHIQRIYFRLLFISKVKKSEGKWII